MRDKLDRYTCRLVQYGVFKENIKNITGRMSIVTLGYMGAAEFEYGALPESTQRMLINIDFYDVFTFPQYVNQEGEPLMVYAPKMFIEHISKIVEELATGTNNHLHARCTLPEYLKGARTFYAANFWWDIENDFYIFFGEQKKDLVLASEQAMRERSIGEVEVGDWTQLSKYYLNNNPDLNDEAKEFLSQEKPNVAHCLAKKRKNKTEQN